MGGDNGNVYTGLSYVTGGTLTKDDCYITLIFEPLTDAPSEYTYRIEYLSAYKNTPFAEQKLKVFNAGEISLNTDGEIKAALGRATMDIPLGDNVTIKFLRWNIEIKGNTKLYTAEYESVKFRTIDYNGNAIDWDIPIISYAEYLTTVKPVFTLLDLNTGGNEWFKTSQEIPHDKLYGYFFSAVFKQKLTDLNYYFKQTTYKGALVFYHYNYVKINKFANTDNLKEKAFS